MGFCNSVHPMCVPLSCPMLSFSYLIVIADSFTLSVRAGSATFPRKNMCDLTRTLLRGPASATLPAHAGIWSFSRNVFSVSLWTTTWLNFPHPFILGLNSSGWPLACWSSRLSLLSPGLDHHNLPESPWFWYMTAYLESPMPQVAPTWLFNSLPHLLLTAQWLESTSTEASWSNHDHYICHFSLFYHHTHTHNQGKMWQVLVKTGTRVAGHLCY